MVNSPELAKRLGISTRTLARYRKEERIPYIKISRRKIVYDLFDVVSAIKAGRLSQGTGEFFERGRKSQKNK